MNTGWTGIEGFNAIFVGMPGRYFVREWGEGRLNVSWLERIAGYYSGCNACFLEV
jgi:hypothetical protein